MNIQLNERQKIILEALEGSKGLSRLEITKKILGKIDVSRPTIIRDLNELLTHKLVKTKGRGRATKYFQYFENPMLGFVDLDDYFSQDMHSRNTRTGFNPKVYNNMRSLLTDDERERWDKSSKIFLAKAEKLNPTIYKREMERFVIELSWKSSQIEGNTYTLLETETLIKQRIEAKGKTKEEAIMILNHKHVFDEIVRNKTSYKRLSLSGLEKFHKDLVSGLEVSSGIRREKVGITGTLYKPLFSLSDIHKNLLRLIDYVNEIPHPAEKALIIAFMIAYLQPFMDGNKRTSRMLSNAILLGHNYYPLSYRDVDVDEYKKALILFYEQNNLYHFKRIFMEQLEFAMENYFK